jgi:hypothetical protein
VSKAIDKESKIIFKYKDIEEMIFKEMASEKLIDNIFKNEVLQKLSQLAQIAREKY